MLALFACTAFESSALSLALDSVAEWGRFPRFIVNTYRWGDGFFNGYDTTYVVGTGYKFNVKTTADTWLEAYDFFLPNDVRMHMVSAPSTTAGVRLTYLAVSAGYERNVSRFFGSPEIKARQQFEFGFNCSLFAFNMYFSDNTGGMKIKSFGAPGQRLKPDIDFYGLKSKSFGFDACYFFNHKRYSQAAAFSFSRVQRRSEGSWFAGLSYSNQEFNFDFNSLPQYIIDALPETWPDHRYEANTKNLGIKFGYGYNWVINPKLALCVSESPNIGLKKGTINNPDKKSTSATFSNMLRFSLVWNHRQWFAGLVGDFDALLIHDKDSTFQNSQFTASASVGYRFNIW